jgi:cytochrome P450
MRNDWSGATFPHPPGRRRIVGDLPVGADRSTPLQNLLRRARGLGPIFELRILRQRFVFVASAELAEQLDDDRHFRKALPPGVEALRVFAGDGLFTAFSDEPNWRLAHDLLRPAFTRPAMQSYHATMNAVAEELIAKWDKATRPVDVSADLTRMTLETIGRTAFSHTFDSFTKTERDPFVVSMIAALRHGQVRGAASAIPGGSLLIRRAEKRAAEHQRRMDAVIDEIIEARLASGDTSQDDLLGLMLNATHEETGAKLDVTNVRRQIITFLVAGHETTSGALSFALYFLATHPEVRAKAQTEADAILGRDPDAKPTFEQIAKFRYIRRVLDETLRLWPTAPGYAREPLEETVVAGRRMKPTDWALIVLPLLHREEAVWGPDADRFDPDNFLPERVRARPGHAYKPFGTGERACIGRQFALHEAVLVLARVLHRYDFTADPDYTLTIVERLTLMPVGFELTPRLRVPDRAPLVDAS